MGDESCGMRGVGGLLMFMLGNEDTGECSVGRGDGVKGNGRG